MLTVSKLPDMHHLSLHDALPICRARGALSIHVSSGTPPEVALPRSSMHDRFRRRAASRPHPAAADAAARSEEHTSELQSPCNLVCRLLLETKKDENIKQDDIFTL